MDYYLSNLIALPSHISRSEEVLKLFDVLDNGFDRETDAINKRFSKPISQNQILIKIDYLNIPILTFYNNNNNNSNNSNMLIIQEVLIIHLLMNHQVQI